MTMLLTGAGKGSPGGGGGTTLFMDEPGLGSAVAGWSIPRRMRAAATNDKILVRRSSDSTTLDIPVVDDVLDEATLSTFGAGTDVFVHTVYDDSGNARDLVQATAANQPQIMAAGVILTGANGKPCARFDGSNDYLQTAAFTLSNPLTYFAVFNQLTWTANDKLFDGRTVNLAYMTQRLTTPNITISQSTTHIVNSSLAVNTWAMTTSVSDTSSSGIAVNDGAESTGTLGATAMGGVTVGSGGNAANFANMEFSEFVVYASNKSSTDRGTARTNINAFYALWV